MSPRPLILIAEDEPDTVRLLEYHLQRHGYRTVAATDGVAALNEALTQKPALIILDLMLPKLHGFEVCRMIRASPAACHIPILMLTAMAGTEYKVTGFRLGADDYLTKPFTMPELLARLDALLHRQAPSAPS